MLVGVEIAEIYFIVMLLLLNIDIYVLICCMSGKAKIHGKLIKPTDLLEQCMYVPKSIDYNVAYYMH